MTYPYLLSVILLVGTCTIAVSGTVITNGASTHTLPFSSAVRTDSSSSSFVRTYDLYIPSTYSKDQTWPIVFYYHPYRASCSLYKAAGQCLHDQDLPVIRSTRSFTAVPTSSFASSSSNLSTVIQNTWKGKADPTLCELVTYAETHSFILVSLCGNNQAWNAGSCCSNPHSSESYFSLPDDAAFLPSVLTDLKQQYSLNIDPLRVWSIGFSNGGMMSHLMACEYPNIVRASVSVSGSLSPFFTNDISSILTTETEIIADTPLSQVSLPSLPEICRTLQENHGSSSSLHHVSVLEVHGGNDVSLPVEGYIDSTVGIASLSQTMDTHAHIAQCSTEVSRSGKKKSPMLVSTTFSSVFEPLLQWQRNNQTIQSYSYPECANGTRIEYVIVQNGGHEWFTPVHHKFDTTEYIIDWLETVADKQYGYRLMQNNKRLMNYDTVYKDTLYKVRLTYHNIFETYPTEDDNYLRFTTEERVRDKDILRMNAMRNAVLPLPHQAKDIDEVYDTDDGTMGTSGGTTTSTNHGIHSMQKYDPSTGVDLELAKEMEDLGDLFVILSQSAEESSNGYTMDEDDEYDEYTDDDNDEEEDDGDEEF